MIMHVFRLPDRSVARFKVYHAWLALGNWAHRVALSKNNLMNADWYEHLVRFAVLADCLVDKEFLNAIIDVMILIYEGGNRALRSSVTKLIYDDLPESLHLKKLAVHIFISGSDRSSVVQHGHEHPQIFLRDVILALMDLASGAAEIKPTSQNRCHFYHYHDPETPPTLACNERLTKVYEMDKDFPRPPPNR